MATFGGISLGSTFSNVPLSTMITSMLYPDYPPIATIDITNTSPNGPLSYNNSLERRHGVAGITIDYTYTLTKLTNDITSTSFLLIRNSTSVGTFPNTTLSGSGLVTQTYPGNAVNIPGSVISAVIGKSVFTFSVSPNDGILPPTTTSISFEVVYPYFYGFSSTSSNNQATTQLYAMAETTKRIDIRGSQSLALSGSGYLHFIYPSSYGTLSNILDGNDFVEYTHGSPGTWIYSTQSLNSPTDPASYWSSASFYVYRKTLETTIPPSQIYKFNF